MQTKTTRGKDIYKKGKLVRIEVTKASLNSGAFPQEAYPFCFHLNSNVAGPIVSLLLLLCKLSRMSSVLVEQEN